MTWKSAASLDKLGSTKRWLPLTVGGVDLIVASVNGTWYGFEDRCTHAGCAFSEDGERDGPQVICNCHGSEFDFRTGAVKRGPAELPIRTFPVRLVEEGLEVDL